MIKTILFDADGVTLKKHTYLSDRLSHDYGIPVEKIVPFFKAEYRTCQLGKADLKEELQKYLPQWNWTKSVDEFLTYRFADDARPDETVMRYVRELRTKGIKCYLATDQEKYRAAYIRNNLGFEQEFDGFFFSHELGHSKAEPEFFQLILDRLKIKPSEIVYFDDEEENIQNALSLGIDARMYSGLDNLKDIKF